MKKVLIFSLLTLVLLMFAGCAAKEAVVPVVEDTYIPVEVMVVETGILDQQVVLNGSMEPNSQVLVFPKVPGKIEDKFVKIGDLVEKEAPLFKMDKEDVLDQVKQAEKSLSLARVNYNMTLDRYNDSQSTLARNKTLFESGAIPKSQYEQAILAASDSQLKSAKLQLEQAQLSYNQAKDSIGDTSIKASIAGVITSVNGEVGDFVVNSNPVITIMDLDKVKLKFGVSESIINKIDEETKISVVIPAVSEDEVISEIEYISPSVGPNSKLYPISLCIDNPDHMIKPGMFAKIIIDISAKEASVLVPDEAILFEPEGLFIFKIVEGQPVKTIIEIGEDNGEFTEVKSGLNPKDEIVIKGQQYIKSDSVIKILRGDN